MSAANRTDESIPNDDQMAFTDAPAARRPLPVYASPATLMAAGLASRKRSR
jgi:hypothetical protein